MNDQVKLRDSLQVKVGTIFLVLAITFSLGSYVALRWLVFPAFAQLERELAIANVDRVKQVFVSEFAGLANVGREYSRWNQSFDFVKGQGQSNYVEDNIAPEVWHDIEIELMVFFDLSGELVWGRHLDQGSNEMTAVDYLKSSASFDLQALMARTSSTSDAKGLIQLPSGLMMLVVQPITQTDGQGPSAGYFVIGRTVSDSRLARYSDRAGVDFSLADPPALGPGPQISAPASSTAIALPQIELGYTDTEVISTEIWLDIYGGELQLLDVRTPRKITAIGTDILRISVLFLAGLGLLLVLMSWVSVRSLVIKPITRLKQHVINMGVTGDLSRSLDLKDGGEIGTLAEEFDLLTSELQSTHMELLEARDQALTSAKMKSEFLASMSHEIRTPMNGVIGMTELLANTQLSSSQRKLVDTVKISADSLLAIINDILDFSKIESGRLAIKKEVFSLDRLIQDINAIVADQAQRKGLLYRCDQSPQLPLGMKSDSQRLRQVLINLLDNAIKFTDEGEVTFCVECTRTWWQDGCEWGALKFSVSDTGIGISRSVKNKIFESFSQADGSNSRTYGGTGLGLSICKALVERMDGKIAFSSEQGKGSEFWVILPAMLSRAEIEEDANSNAALEPLNDQPPQMAQPSPGNVVPIIPPVEPAAKLDARVLVVEDNQVNQELAMMLLEDFGCSATLAENGQVALKLLEHESFDLVLMDCQMPVMDGFEATKIIRRMKLEAKSGGPLPIVAITANAMTGDRERCIEAGMDDYLSKPFDQLDLYNVLRSMLSESCAGMKLDPAALDQIRSLQKNGQPNILHRVIDAYLDASPALVAALGAGVAAKDPQALQASAHTLKSSSASVGAIQFSHLCAQIEALGRKGSLENADSLVRQVQSEFVNVCDALTRARSSA